MSILGISVPDERYGAVWTCGTFDRIEYSPNLYSRYRDRHQVALFAEFRQGWSFPAWPATAPADRYIARDAAIDRQEPP
jgi:hypothetical protein